MTIAYAEGPGGPVNTIVITQSFYQVILDVFVAKQPLGLFGLIGFFVGIFGTISIALGNMIIKKVITKE